MHLSLPFRDLFDISFPFDGEYILRTHFGNA